MKQECLAMWSCCLEIQRWTVVSRNQHNMVQSEGSTLHLWPEKHIENQPPLHTCIRDPTLFKGHGGRGVGVFGNAQVEDACSNMAAWTLNMWGHGTHQLEMHAQSQLMMSSYRFLFRAIKATVCAWMCPYMHNVGASTPTQTSRRAKREKTQHMPTLCCL